MICKRCGYGGYGIMNINKIHVGHGIELSFKDPINLCSECIDEVIQDVNLSVEEPHK
jgi:hypothetical protein